MIRQSLAFAHALGKFCIPQRPWDEHDCEANAGQLLCKNKNKPEKFALSHWKKIEILKIVRF